MIIQRLTPLVNNLLLKTLFTKSMLQKENESLSILFLGQAKNITFLNLRNNINFILRKNLME